jgi:sterol desaturase/sphingolipid hydroxylase (fatty acid hydroxylase superfamily)
MMHHLAIYGPLQNQRSGKYKDATDDRMALGNVGLEWLIPAAFLLISALVAYHLLHVRLAYQLVSLGASLVWGFLMFSYLHDVMHVEGFWMEKSRWLRGWFTSARTLHDIHHQVINRKGFMDKNFGIGFFFFDRLFGTLCQTSQSTDRVAYERALTRFNAILR